MDQELEQANRTQSLVNAFAAIRGGDLSQIWLARFSDLSREGARTLRREWRRFPENVRVAIVRRYDELSEERVDLNFRRAGVARFGRIVFDDF